MLCKEAVPPLCGPQSVTVVGAYLFGNQTQDAGVYSYYGKLRGEAAAGPRALF